MRTIFLLDIDCFFASVEMALHPELKGRPLCIGGGERGIVVCPNYEARAYGVRTAMPCRMAERLLPPDAVFLPGNHRLYSEYSERVMKILEDFTPDIEQVSVDEAYMDVTGCLQLWAHHPRPMAEMMKERIRRECGLSVSIGIASNKVCAKIAAGLKKPDGLVIVPHGQEQAFLAPLPIEVVPGVGKKTLPKLHAQGIFTVADVQAHSVVEHPHRLPSSATQATFPMSWLGRYLTAVAHGEDRRVVRGDTVEKSISRDTTFGHDTNDLSFMTATLYYLTERCCKTLRKRNQVASTVTVKVRFADFTTIQKQVTLHDATANEEEVFPLARQMLDNLLPQHRSVRLVGVKVSKILAADHVQMQFDATMSERRERLHRRLDALQTKHGYKSIQWGITHALGSAFRTGDDGYELHSPVYEL
jgi:DNA polymerase IV